MIIAKEVHKTYTNGLKKIKALNGVSLEARAGESIAILGPSGAGKSTLLHLLGGLDEPTSGNIVLDGVDIYRLSDREKASVRNKRIGFIFQFYNLLPEFTALENIMLPGLIECRSTRNTKYEIRKIARSFLDIVGLEDRIDHRPGELSGGESQRVAIARALINKPEILLCDEPTGNLDSKASEAIYKLLFDLNSKFNMTLIVVTHDESLASRFNRTIRIKDGKII